MQIIVKLTTNCNLNCIYCSEGDKKAVTLKKEMLFKAIDELPLLLDKINDKNITLLWHGGEPLSVGKEYLTEVMQYATEKLKNYHIKFLIQTNGTLIDDEWISIFCKFKVGIGISLDGYKELHDNNRLTKNGEATFDLIVKNMQKLKNAGVNYGTLMVLNTSSQINMEALTKCIEEYDLHPKIHSVIACGRASEVDSVAVYENYVELMKELYRYCMESDRNIIMEPLNELMDTILGVDSVHECSFNGSCGVSFICIYADGSAGFCGRAEHEKDDFTYGSLEDKNLLELYESVNAQRIRSRQQYLKEHDCYGCNYWHLCHGGCAFEAVTATGSLYSKYVNCGMRKSLLDFLQTEGLQLLKEKLIRQKGRYRTLISEKNKLIGSMSDEKK